MAVLLKKFFDTSRQLVEALEISSQTLQNINRLFIEIIGRYGVSFTHELKPVDPRDTRLSVVDEDSASGIAAVCASWKTRMLLATMSLQTQFKGILREHPRLY